MAFGVEEGREELSGEGERRRADLGVSHGVLVAHVDVLDLNLEVIYDLLDEARPDSLVSWGRG